MSLSYWELVDDPDVVAHYMPAGGTTDSGADASGNGHTLNWTGTPGYGDAQFGRGYVFTGTNYLTSAGPVLPTGSAQRAVLCRFIAATGANANNRYIWGQSVNTAGRAFRISCPNPSGSGGTVGAIRAEFIGGYQAGTTVVTRDVWHTAAMVVPTGATVSDDVTVYLDAAAITQSDSTSVALDSGSAVLMVGDDAVSGDRPLIGEVADLLAFDRSVTAAEISQYHAGPEPRYTSGASLAANGALDVGSWDDYSNGSATFEWVVANAAGDVIDSGTGSTDTASLSGVSSGTQLYLLVRSTNDGGFDVGDYSTRTSDYGSAGDGYYELASVTLNYLARYSRTWWLGR